MSLGYPVGLKVVVHHIMLSIVIGEVQLACNKSLSMCPGLSHGLISALKEYGSDEQKGMVAKTRNWGMGRNHVSNGTTKWYRLGSCIHQS